MHRAELEMQYDELVAANAETARRGVRYQRLYELAPVGCVTVDRSGRVQESNLRAAILFGVAHSELGGRPLQKFMPELAADILHRHLRSVFSTSTRQTCKVVLERSGTRPGSFPVRIESIVVPDETGKCLECQSVLINLSEIPDIQEGPLTPEPVTTTTTEPAPNPIVGIDAEAYIESLNNAAERLDSMREERDFAERLLASAPVMVLVLDLDGCIVRFNRCFEDITGYRLDEVRGADWFKTFLPEEDHAQGRATFARLLREKVTMGTVSAIRTKRGNKVEVEWRNTVLRDVRASMCGYMSIGVEAPPHRQLAR
ncbi:MAG TPA: PAS domain S-box protein [Planctomycetota bacterium]